MKNIVICCDGTGNEYGPNNTNVVKLYQSVIRDTEQIAFYDPGVGTFWGRELWTAHWNPAGAGFRHGFATKY